MNPLNKKVALKVHPLTFLYNKNIRNHRCTNDRNEAFIRIRAEILLDPEFAYLAVQWADDLLVVKRRWRSIRSTYCSLQLQLINAEIQEEDLTEGQREMLITLSFLEPFVQHVNGRANIGIGLPNPNLQNILLAALEDYLGDNPHQLQQVLARLQAGGIPLPIRRAPVPRRGGNRLVGPQGLPIPRPNRGNRRVR